MNRFQKRAQAMRTPQPGFGEAVCEEYAVKARKAMHKHDTMPPEFRALVHDFGLGKVRSRMMEGRSPEQIKAELPA